MLLSDKYWDYIDTPARAEFLEGSTASGKTTTVAVKFIMNVAESDMKLHVIAGNTTGVIEKNIINADMGLLQIFPNLEYCGNGDKENKLPHIKFKTGSSTKIIYILGYDNASKWKNALGSQFGCVWVDECNTANIDFIREIFGRSEYFVGTLNPDAPTLPIYSEYINHARPIDKYKADVPEEIWKDLNGCEPIKDWVYWFFTFEDNISMTPEKIEQKKMSYPPGTKIYKNKILGLRGKATGLVFSNFCKRHVITKEQAKVFIKQEYDDKQTEWFVIYTSGLDTAYSTKSPDTIAMSFMGITNKGKLIVLDEKVYNNVYGADINCAIESRSVSGNGQSTVEKTLQKENIKINKVVYIFCILNCMLMSEFWIIERNKEFAIKRTYGFGQLRLIGGIARDILILGVASLVIYVLVHLFAVGVLGIKLYTISWNLRLIASVLFINLTALVCTIIVPVYRIMKMNPAVTLEDME